ncbi:MAG: dienelactone hydrolase family protein [Solirubrobacterales bacterium]|nr:dienelactone hydrolase family protein [Solirubrobacterales bacterium]
MARLLERFRAQDPVVVGIPRGGVPVAAEVARALGAPLDVALVRKIGAPGHREYALGAVAEGGVLVVADEAVRGIGLGSAGVGELVAATRAELDERLHRYRGDRPPAPIAGRTVLLVDDGLATGRSARAAALSLRRRGAGRIVLAVPVAAPSSVAALGDCVDEVVCVEQPPDLWAVGLWYDDFRPTWDDEVAALLARHAPPTARTARTVAVHGGPGVLLAGELAAPGSALGVVAFAHGSGSSRRSPRNRAVAAALREAGIATLLFDLLRPQEEADRANVFDIPLLASRLVGATRWLRHQHDTRDLPLGYFGASTGAAAALVAAAEAGADVRAVVARGGRPDLAGPSLPDVVTPTLLIVGGADPAVLDLNREALEQLTCPAELAVVPGATHLFEEPGTLDDVARLAIGWFTRHLPATPRGAAAPSAGAAARRS